MIHGATFDYLYGNRVAIGTAIIALTTAAVKTAPIPGQAINFYAWFYDFTHQIFNITNTRLNPTLTPTPPLTQEQAGTTIPKQ